MLRFEHSLDSEHSVYLFYSSFEAVADQQVLSSVRLILVRKHLTSPDFIVILLITMRSCVLMLF